MGLLTNLLEYIEHRLVLEQLQNLLLLGIWEICQNPDFQNRPEILRMVNTKHCDDKILQNSRRSHTMDCRSCGWKDGYVYMQSNWSGGNKMARLQPITWQNKFSCSSKCAGVTLPRNIEWRQRFVFEISFEIFVQAQHLLDQLATSWKWALSNCWLLSGR